MLVQCTTKMEAFCENGPKQWKLQYAYCNLPWTSVQEYYASSRIFNSFNERCCIKDFPGKFGYILCWNTADTFALLPRLIPVVKNNQSEYRKSSILKETSVSSSIFLPSAGRENVYRSLVNRPYWIAIQYWLLYSIQGGEPPITYHFFFGKRAHGNLQIWWKLMYLVGQRCSLEDTERFMSKT